MLRYLIAYVIFSFVAFQSSTYGQNLILNGSFTGGSTNWNFFSPGTTTEATNPETTYGGTSATNIVCEIDAQSNARQVFIVTPGVEYSFSFRYSRRTGNGPAPNPTTINAKIYDAATAYINQDIVANNANWEWTCYTATFTPTSNSVTLDFSYAMAGIVTLGAIIDDITITPNTAQTITDSGVTCQGGNLTIYAPSFPADPDVQYSNYDWSGPGGFTSSDSIIHFTDLQTSQSGTYTVTMTMNYCLNVSGSYLLEVGVVSGTENITVCSNELPYNWNGHSLNGAGTYTDTSTNANGCDSITTLTLSVTPTAISTVDTYVCGGQFPFIWHATTISDFGNNAASYTVQTINGCDSTVSLNVLQSDVQIAVDLGDNKTICPGDSVFISAEISPWGNYIYSWTPNGTYFPQNQPNIVYTGDTDITLTLHVTSPQGCIGVDSMKIFVRPQLFTSANTHDTGYCSGSDSLQLSVSGGVSYQWVPSYGLSNDTIANPLASPHTSTDYTVYITGSSGCKDTQNIKVSVYPNAIIHMPDSVNLYPGESYQMDPEGNCLYFTWYPPSGLSATNISNPIATPEVRTRYFVTGTTENGCSVDDSIDVLVVGSLIDMPNAFTPGNGPNNIFKPAYKGIVRLNSFQIFNRWGQKVFENSDINKGWDGTFNNKPQPVGVYIYMIDAVTDNGKPFVKQGNVTLLR